jgi:hypothetical protein
MGERKSHGEHEGHGGYERAAGRSSTQLLDLRGCCIPVRQMGLEVEIGEKVARTTRSSVLSK